MEKEITQLSKPLQSLDSFVSLMFYMDKWTINHPEYNVSFLVGDDSLNILISK